KHFQPACLLPEKIQASLGQTLWLYGEVNVNQNCAQLAKECAIALLAGTSLNPIEINQEKLFGSLLFEYQAIEPNQPDNLTKQCQILISLNNSSANTAQLATEAYDWLLNLLCCHHKIQYVYQQSRVRYPQARKLYSNLEQQMGDIPKLTTNTQKKLKTLNNLLVQIPQTSLDYARCLRDLKAHLTAIETNSTNYRLYQEKINKIGESPQSWQNFLKNCHKRQTQIQTDINYLTPGQELFGQMVETIRGIVEIEQAESDRSLERTIQILGAGLGTGGIVASAISSHIETPITFKPTWKWNTLHPAFNTLFWSIIIAFGAAGATWLLTKKKEQ
ncbi:MAG: hypothetical protein F6J89_10735, partial [Symploca sp. SIO1C4]|nr:hypothetical protein [Symploca sp. SIO1C4]